MPKHDPWNSTNQKYSHMSYIHQMYKCDVYLIMTKQIYAIWILH